MSTVQLKLLSPVEVARGATLFHQINLTHENKLVLERVALNENHAAAKWRYPYIQQNLDRPITANIDLISACPNNVHLYEPIEVGSFVQRRDETGDSCLYRLAKLSSSTKTDDAEASNVILSSDEKCFLPLAELSDLLLDLMQNTKAKFKLQLEQKRHLLNLLPPTSIQCSELQIGSAGISCHDTIIYGDSGSGKTHTALFLAARARFLSHTSTFYLDCKRLKEGRNIRMTHILSELHGIFHDAKSSSGSSLIILDDFAELAPNFEDSSGADGSAQLNQVNLVAVDQSKLIADTTRLLIETVAGTDKSVAVIITARDVRSLPPSILSTRPFLRTIKSPSLSGAERESLLWRMLCSDRPDMLDEELCADYLAIHIGRKTEAYRPKDLQILAARARHQLETTGINYSVVALAKSALIAVQDFTPMRLLSSNELTSSAAEWSDIGGLFKVKEELTTTVMNPTKYCRIYEMANIRLPRGLLLFGPPGTGKSHVVPALAKKCGFCLVTCRGPELLDRYIGASESKVRELFDRARASAPSILFFDEIDSLAPRRGSDKTGVTDRVVNQLLTLLDGVEDTASVGLVYIVAATSRPDIVDPALLRPGRLEKHIYVGYSENDKELNDLLVKVAARYPIDTETFDMIKSGRLTEEMYHSLPHSKLFSAADYKAAFDTAQLSAIHDLLQCDKGDAEVSIRYRHLVAAVGATRPSLPQRDYTALMEAYRPFRKDITEQSGDGDLTSAANAHYRKSARKDLRTALR